MAESDQYKILRLVVGSEFFLGCFGGEIEIKIDFFVVTFRAHLLNVFDGTRCFSR